MDIVQAERDDARKGALYFLGNTRIGPAPSLDLGIVNNFAGSSGIVSDMKTMSTALLPKSVKKTFEVPSVILGQVTELLQSFFHTMQGKLLEIFGDALHGLEWFGEFVSWGISVFAGSLASAIPGWGYVQAAGDMYNGVKAAVLNAKDLIINLWSQRGVKLADGLPHDIADALARHSAVGIASGVKDVGIASVSIGLEAAGDSVGGAGMIVSIVTGVLQRIASLVDWCIQRFRVKAVLRQASEAWSSKSELLQDHAVFNKWFRRNILCTPIIAALVLSSGFVAHSNRFLILINPDDTITDQKSFDAGVRYIERLKNIAGNYIHNYTENYKLTFTSAEPVVAARLEKVV